MIWTIITAWKEPKTIGKAIERLQEQKIKDQKIIVVCPDEETKKEALKYPIIYLKDPGKGKPTALNTAFNYIKKKGKKKEFIILTDGDVFINKESLPFLLKPFEDKKIGEVTGRPLALEDKSTLFGFWANIQNDAWHNIREKRAKEKKFIFCSGYLFAIRFECMEEIPADCLDDGYISRRIWDKGYHITYAPKAEVFIKNPATLKDWIKQKRRNAFGHTNIKKHLGKGQEMKSLKEEIFQGTKLILLSPRNPHQMIWVLFLFMMRLYTWVISFYDQIKKKGV